MVIIDLFGETEAVERIISETETCCPLYDECKSTESLSRETCTSRKCNTYYHRFGIQKPRSYSPFSVNGNGQKK